MFIGRKTIRSTVSSDRPFIRLFTKRNINKFCSSLINEDWSNVYSSSNPNLAFDNFSQKLNYHFESNFKLTRASRKSMKYNKPWITSSIKMCINKKCAMYQKWVASLQPEDETCYKNYSKILRKIINKFEAAYYVKMCDTKFQSIKTVWRNLNKICNFNINRRSRLQIKKIKLNN